MAITDIYRGYAVQALYALKRILADAGEDLLFCPEGNEDLDIRDSKGKLLEIVQVKSSSPLVLSDLGSGKKQDPFFKRALRLRAENDGIAIKVVNFGPVGSEIADVWGGQSGSENGKSDGVIEKLVEKHGLERDDAETAIRVVEIESLDREVENSAALEAIKKTVAGIAPDHSFDLFIQWIYKVSEERGRIGRGDIVSKLNDIGRVLSQLQNYVKEWNMSIQPVGLAFDSMAENGTREKLETEFFRGVSARYEHIFHGLDFKRNDKLHAVAKAFEDSEPVIVRGASGQGKSVLAYRFLHEYFPDNWRYEVGKIDDPAHARRIASAFNAQAESLGAPMAVYIDVRPNSTEWTELVEILSRQPLLKVLVTVRQEDFRRAGLRSYAFDFKTVDLRFDEEEARSIYDRATERKPSVKRKYPRFEDSWDAFEESGPLLEYVFLLTQTTSLKQRLREQLDNIGAEVRKEESADKWNVLRIVAFASAYESRVVFSELKKAAEHPSLIGQEVARLEEEYLVRRTHDRIHLEGLHPVRSQIIVKLMLEDDPEAWDDAVSDLLSSLCESDLQFFLLKALIDRPIPEQKRLLHKAVSFCPGTWTGRANVLRSLLWAGVRDYVETCRAGTEKIGANIPNAVLQIMVPIDFKGLLEGNPNSLDDLLADYGNPGVLEKIQQIRKNREPKERAFDFAKKWLECQTVPPAHPETPNDWIGLAEICFWSGWLEAGVLVTEWLDDVPLEDAMERFDLRIAADVAACLFVSSPEKYSAAMERFGTTIEKRLASEYGIFALEKDLEGERDGKSRTTIHFTTDPIRRESSVDTGIPLNRYDNELHGAAMERIELAVQLYPQYEKIESRAYGFRAGELLALPVDETYKDMEARYARFHWLFRLNRVARGLMEYKYRPDDWGEYASILLQARQQVVESLHKLRNLLELYLKRTKGVDYFRNGMFDEKAWDATRILLNSLPGLPKSALDPWGFSSESSSSSALTPLETLSLIKANTGEEISPQSPLMSRAIVAKEYAALLKSISEYSQHMSNFFFQAPHVMLTNLHMKRFRKNNAKRCQMKEIVVQKGYRTDLADLSIRNFCDAKRALPEFQKRFREWLTPLVDEALLETLEKEEAKFVSETWIFWYWFATEPDRLWSHPHRQIPISMDLSGKNLLNAIDSTLARYNASAKGRQRAFRLETNVAWEGKSSLWILMDLDYAIDCYQAIGKLLETLKNGLGEQFSRPLSKYYQEKCFDTTVLVPTVRGKMWDSFCYPINSQFSLYPGFSAEKFPFSYFPAVLPEEKRIGLEVAKWEMPEVTYASDFHKSLAEIYFLSSQLSEFLGAPVNFMNEHASRTLQNHLNEKAKLIGESLNSLIKSSRHFRKRFRSKPRAIQSGDVSAEDMMQACEEILDVVLPERQTAFVLSLEQTLDYSKRLLDAVKIGLALRLHWIDDIISEVEEQEI